MIIPPKGYNPFGNPMLGKVVVGRDAWRAAMRKPSRAEVISIPSYAIIGNHPGASLFPPQAALRFGTPPLEGNLWRYNAVHL